MTTTSEEFSDTMEQVLISPINVPSLSEAVQYDSSSASDSHFGSLPDLPQRLLARRRESSNSSATNKAKVLVVLQSEIETSTASCVSIEPVTRFIKLARPQPKKEDGKSEPRVGISQAPKIFPVDGVYTFPKEKDDLYAAVLGDQIVGILDGFDGSIIYFKSVRQGLSHAESPDLCSSNLDLFPAAVKLLFRIIEDDPNGDHLKYHVAVSALELKYSGRSSWDLLADLGNQSVKQTCDRETESTEIPATNAKEALSYVDAALLEKRRFDHLHLLDEPLYPGSHLFLTLHLYRDQQENDDDNSMGRMKHSRLHIIELVNPFGLEENPLPTTTQASSFQPQNERDFQHSVLASALMMLSGQMSVNLKESCLLQLLHKCISENVRMTSLVIHTFVGLEYYMQNLHLLQFSAKFQNFWRRQGSSRSFCASRRPPSSTTEAQNKAGILDRTQRLGRISHRLHRRHPIPGRGRHRSQGLEDAEHASQSDIEYTSSSEQSCTTVIYLGRSRPLRRQLEMSRRVGANESLERFPPELAENQTKDTGAEPVLPMLASSSQEPIRERRHSADAGTDAAREEAQPSGTLPPQATTRHREAYNKRQRFKQHRQHLLASRSIELWVDGPKSQPPDSPSAWTGAGRVLKEFQAKKPDTNLWHLTDWKAADNREAFRKISLEEIKDEESKLRRQVVLDGGQRGTFNTQHSTPKHSRKSKQGYLLSDPRTRRPGPPPHTSDVHQAKCFQTNSNASTSDDLAGLPPTIGSPGLSRGQLQQKPELGRREVYQAQQSRVTPFVKEWIEKQNTAFSGGQREASLQRTQPTLDSDTWTEIHTITNPISCLEAQVETVIKSGPAVEVATPLTSIRSSFSRKTVTTLSKGTQGRDFAVRTLSATNNNCPLTPSRSLPRPVTTEGWSQGSPFADSSLSRVARWVDSVSKVTTLGSPGMVSSKVPTCVDPATSPNAALHLRHLPPSRGAPIGASESTAFPLDTEVKVSQANVGYRIGSAVRSPHPVHCLAMFKLIEEEHTPVLPGPSPSGRTEGGMARYDCQKPDGASDPGFAQELHPYSGEKKKVQQQVAASNDVCQAEAPKQQVVSKRPNRTHKRLQKFTDFFVCSPHVSTRQNTTSVTAVTGGRPSTARVRRMCAPFFWPSVARDPRESELSDDVLSVDSVGMLFTTSANRREDRSLSCSSQTKPLHAEASVQGGEPFILKPKSRQKPGNLPLPEKSDDSDGQWLGFAPNPRCTNCSGQSSARPTGLGLSSKLQSCLSLGQDVSPMVMRATAATTDDPVTTKYNAATIHSADETCIVPTTTITTNTVNSRSPKIELNPMRQWPLKVLSSTSAKCVSQSSSSGLGSEHSCTDSAARTDAGNEPATVAPTDTTALTVRCYCKQSVGRVPRCKTRGHYGHSHRHIAVTDAYLELVKAPLQTTAPRALPYLVDSGLPAANLPSTGPSPVIESREPRSYVGGGGGGGHASSGYESVLRDSEVSSHSETASESSLGQITSTGEAFQCGVLTLQHQPQQLQLPLKGRDDAACQTSPFPSDTWDGRGPCEVKSMQPTPEGSLTLTESLSEATASAAMNSSTTSKNSNPRPLSRSNSKRSIFVPAQSEHTSEESTSSLPSVRHVSPSFNRVKSSLDRVQLTESQALQSSTTEAHCPPASEADVSETRKMKILSLLSRQEALKAELTAAKSRLLADPGSWGFDLSVSEKMDLDDECFVEALENETELLQQRVNACNFHVQYMSYFYPPSLDSDP